MKLVITFLAFFAFSICSFGQNKAEDSVKLVQTASWLNQKLTYNYFNADDGEWWQNRFDFDPLTMKATVRNVSSLRLGAIQDRTHMQRVFQFGDLNPYNIRIEQTKENAGRLVRGKIIRLGTYQQSKDIKQMKNGSVPSESSFLYFSIPSVYDDSVKNYSEDIVDKLKEAILIAIKVYPTGSFDRDASQLFSVLENDRFISDAAGVIEVSKIFDDVLELDHYDANNKLVRKGFLKKYSGQQTIKWIGVQEMNPVGDEDLKFGNENEFLISTENFKILFINKHEFRIIEKGTEMTFIRDNSFEKGRPYYR